MDGAAAGAQVFVRPKHRLLVINLDRAWPFTRLWRRMCPDLFRQRAPHWIAGEAERSDPLSYELEVWDALDAEPTDPAERERARIWRHWPKPLVGGPAAAAAEFEDKMADDLAGDGLPLDQIDHQLVIFVAVGVADLADGDGGTPSRLARLLGGLGQYFAEGAHKVYRRNITLAVVVNSWEGVVRRQVLLDRLVRVEQYTGVAIDLAFVSDRRLDAQAPPEDARQESNLRLLRLAFDVLADQQVHQNLVNAVKAHRNDHKMPMLLRIAIRDIQIETGERRYADTICSALDSVDAERSTVHATRPGEVNLFVQDIKARIKGSEEIVNAVVQASDRSLMRDDSPEFRQDPIWHGIGSLSFKDISRNAGLDARTQRALTEFLTRLNTAIRSNLEAQNGTLATAESQSVQQREAHVLRLREGLGLEQLGHGNPGKLNLSYSRVELDKAMAEVNRRIDEFWSVFAGRPHDTSLTGAAGLTQTHCPSLDLYWPEVKRLTTAYDGALEAINGLAFKPSSVLWGLMCVGMFLALPLLSVGLATVGQRSQVLHPFGYAVWLCMFLVALFLPWWGLRKPRIKVRAALGALNDAARDLVKEIETKLGKVTEYLGTIQRHRYLHALDLRLVELDQECDFVDNYLIRVRETLAATGQTRQTIALTPDQQAIASVVSQTGGSSATKLTEWLPLALRHFRRDVREDVISANVLGGSMRPVASSIVVAPLEIEIVEYREQHGP